MTADAPKVLVVAGDPGGAAALEPVLQRTAGRGDAGWRLCGYAQAPVIWRRNGLACEELPDEADADYFSRLMREGRVDVLVLGTSVNRQMLEAKALAAARRLGIPAIAVLDFWSNYARRFPGGAEGVPDVVAVMDDQARDEMIAEGLPADRLVVTGQPAFAGLAEARRAFTPERRAGIRRRFGIRDDERWVFFFSQPLMDFYGAETDAPGHPGYTERPVFAAVGETLSQVAGTAGVPAALTLRRHPRESDWRDETPLSGRVRRVADDDGVPSREAAMAADLVVGMTSAILVEACYLGCIVVSAQPGLRGNDPLPTNRQGWSLPAYDREQLGVVLRRALTDEDFRAGHVRRLAHFTPPVDAAERVMELVLALPANRKHAAGRIDT